MIWKLHDDRTDAIITAQKHITSSHGHADISQLSETCVIFEMGMAIPYLESHYQTVTITEHLPGFITDQKCIRLADNEHVCFVRGGYGAPAAVDTLETALALGAKRVLIFGMCGGFSSKLHVGDILVPAKIFSEEGTSRHYLGDLESVRADSTLQKALSKHFSQNFRVLNDPTLSMDAVYRQTMAKEALWRQNGCIAVDMEASALLAVCEYYNIPAAVALICSDCHPLPEKMQSWTWGSVDFKEQQKAFVEQCIRFAAAISNPHPQIDHV